MKRLLFVPSLVVVGLLAGCATQLTDSQGNPVCDSSGNPVMVSGSTKEKVEKNVVVVRETVRSEIKKVVENGLTPPPPSAGTPPPPSAGTPVAPPAELPDVASVGLTEEKARSIAGADASEEEIAALKAVAEAEARKYLTEVVYPARVAEEKKKIDAAVSEFISKSEFKKASEYLASIKKTGVKEVDDPVQAYAVEQNKSRVAPAYAESIITKISPFVDKQIANGEYA